ncbi:GNAT family N-acetyltransferase [Streptomyces kaempferi]
MQPSPAAVEVRKDEATRLYEALVDDQVVGTLAYETTGGRATLTHSYVDPDQRHRGIASALARHALEDLAQGPRLASTAVLSPTTSKTTPSGTTPSTSAARPSSPLAPRETRPASADTVK